MLKTSEINWMPSSHQNPSLSTEMESESYLKDGRIPSINSFDEITKKLMHRPNSFQSIFMNTIIVINNNSFDINKFDQRQPLQCSFSAAQYYNIYNSVDASFNYFDCTSYYGPVRFISSCIIFILKFYFEYKIYL